MSSAAPALTSCAYSPAPTTTLRRLLQQVQVIPTRPPVLGYQRSCRHGARCVFGPPWTDDHRGLGGHTGCDGRNEVLARSAHDVVYRPSRRRCVVLSATLLDPYTGQLIHYTKERAQLVQIDHVAPLAVAWDMGAWRWSQQQRVDFANDQALELLAVSGVANEAKGDRTPAQWLPSDPSYRCAYVTR